MSWGIFGSVNISSHLSAVVRYCSVCVCVCVVCVCVCRFSGEGFGVCPSVLCVCMGGGWACLVESL